MKVTFTQSGGFSGLVKGCELDTETLDPAARHEIERLVQASGLSGTGEFLSKTARDLRQYDITIEVGSDRVRLTYDDASLPAAAKPLIALLKKHARPRRA